ncbi:MAG: aldo/keto reductase [Pseudomonadota bacterium]
MRLALGTVQFGVDYGVSNTLGRIPSAMVSEILGVALGAGVDVLDTACLYGDAEAVLGATLPPAASVRIITKTPRFDEDGARGPLRLREALDGSLARLRRDRVDGLLFHHAPDLLGPHGDALWAEATALREDGRVAAVGVSVYAPQDAARLLDRYPLEIVQLPLNVLDRRFSEAGLPERLAEAGVEVHVRSAFLQGLLLMEPRTVPGYFAPIQGLLDGYHGARCRAGLSPVEAALGFLRGVPGIARVVVGVTRPEELRECVAAAACPKTMDYAPYSCQDPAMVEPFRWELT